MNAPVHIETGHALVRYDAMCKAIEAAFRVDEVKDIRDKAKAWEEYSRQAKNIDAERHACEIRLRAERKAGQLLAKMEKQHGARGNPGGRGAKIVEGDDSRPQTLKDLGVSQNQSKRWQKLAAVPEDEFEGALGGDKKPTTNGIIAPKGEPGPSDSALWLWGRLRDFERNGTLDAEPSELMLEMTDSMKTETLRLAPLVAEWLERITDDA